MMIESISVANTDFFSTYGWPLEGSISHDQKNCYRFGESAETPESITPSDQPGTEIIRDQLGLSTSFTAYQSGSGDFNMVKKLNHNASERDRRKKINSLYSSLRSLLPSTDQTKKLSIPGTVSRVLRYIPQLQKQVDRLIQRKEELLSKLSSSKQDGLIANGHQQEVINGHTRMDCNLSSASATSLSDREVMIQISTPDAHRISPLSRILLALEQHDGLVLINSSSFQSIEGRRLFYNLHLQVVEGKYITECEALSKKLVSLYEKRESLFP